MSILFFTVFQLRRKAHQLWGDGLILNSIHQDFPSSYDLYSYQKALRETQPFTVAYNCVLYTVCFYCHPLNNLVSPFNQYTIVFCSKMVSGEERNVSEWSLLSGWRIINDPSSTDGYESIQKCLDVRVHHVPQDAFFFLIRFLTYTLCPDPFWASVIFNNK